eukprot:5959032-Prorocentrum_lima.AAC.1
MTSSLVGSEMCIRDRTTGVSLGVGLSQRLTIRCVPPSATGGLSRRSVSYTHLTLPTICSV